MDSIIQFGTSGLRGPADGFTLVNIAAYAGAFLSTAVTGDGKNIVYVGADFRDSSPRIAACCISAIHADGWKTVYAGNVPTPALASYAMTKNCPAIMITGSHIPESYNGIKFYRRDGELLKEDEIPISERAAQLMKTLMSPPSLSLPVAASEVARCYVTRFTSIFTPNTLKGMRIGIDMHSAVGRDLLQEILETLGAACFPFRRSDEFIALDTEALSEKDIARAQSQITKHNLHGVVSTDGDGDRPLLIDENGNQINGDILGVLTAKFLGIETVVTPISSTSAIEKSEWFSKIVRTKIGSPYVVSAMATEVQTGKKIAGFEANGGFLLGSDITLPDGQLMAMPTRDALLPLIAVLGAANAQSISLSALASNLPNRFMKAGRIKNIPHLRAQEFLSKIQSSNNFRINIDKRLSNPENINTLDGVRMIFSNSSIIHFRQSGNAPEMRCYVETGDKSQTDQLLHDIITSLDIHLDTQ